MNHEHWKKIDMEENGPLECFYPECNCKAPGLQCDSLPKHPEAVVHLPTEDNRPNPYKVLEGTKYDQNKPRLDLIPTDALIAVANVYSIGARKYAERNWELGMKWSRVYRALLSHLWKWWRGEEYDKEDGQHHLESVVWCSLALLTYHLRQVGQDDRPRSNVSDPGDSQDRDTETQQDL